MKKNKINIIDLFTEVDDKRDVDKFFELISKIRKFWKINPKSRIKKSKKKYNRKRAKRNLRKRLKEV